MATPIEHYALLGDLYGGALVSTDGAVDWLAVPRFDSGSCFSALIGGEDDGHWLIAPTERAARVTRRYRGDTLVLETDFATPGGTIRLVDAMIVGEGESRHLVRIVEGIEGEVEVECRFVPRFDYGAAAPWLRQVENEILAVSGPDALVLRGDVPLEREDRRYRGRFRVRAGESKRFVLAWYPSHHQVPKAIDAHAAVERTERWWSEWSAACAYTGPYREAVMRSLIVLKALTYAPTGAIVAAPTTSLPEAIGGVRNWDYRYCWLRDATFTVTALLNAGYRHEADAFVAWLTRAIAGDPAELQILYGLAGERRLDEYEATWLGGYEGSKPVRIGNAAYAQFQLDVYGEVVEVLFQAVNAGMRVHEAFWEMLERIVAFVGQNWKRPDRGIWEVRGPARHFVYSKVMAWVVFDCAVKLVEGGHFAGPLDAWRATRDEIHAEVLERGFDRELGSFVQSYGARELDASLLRIPLVGFLPPSDPRVRGTVAAIERELFRSPFVHRYTSAEEIDGLPSGEGAFLACSFWLVDAYALMDRHEEARTLFERLLRLRNEVGLLSEEHDADNNRMLGNFPQAFSHLALVDAALRLDRRSS